MDINNIAAQTYDPEYERLYGEKGFPDVSMMSDWEKDSDISG